MLNHRFGQLRLYQAECSSRWDGWCWYLIPQVGSAMLEVATSVVNGLACGQLIPWVQSKHNGCGAQDVLVLPLNTMSARELLARLLGPTQHPPIYHVIIHILHYCIVQNMNDNMVNSMLCLQVIGVSPLMPYWHLALIPIPWQHLPILCLFFVFCSLIHVTFVIIFVFCNTVLLPNMMIIQETYIEVVSQNGKNCRKIGALHRPNAVACFTYLWPLTQYMARNVNDNSTSFVP